MRCLCCSKRYRKRVNKLQFRHKKLNKVFREFTTIVKCYAFYLSALISSRAQLKMTVLQQISNPYLASLVLGLLYGLTVCASACLPYILSYITGIGAGFKKGVIITTVYNSGRIVAYALIGTIVGLLSTVIGEEFFSSYQQYFSIASEPSL